MGWKWPWVWEPDICRILSARNLRILLKTLAPGAQIIIKDRTYNVPSNPQAVLTKCSSSFFPYIKEKRDCDDFVRIARGELSRLGEGNLLAMDMDLARPGKTSHAVLGFLSPSMDGFVYGDGQSTRIVEYAEAKPYHIIA